MARAAEKLNSTGAHRVGLGRVDPPVSADLDRMAHIMRERTSRAVRTVFVGSLFLLPGCGSDSPTAPSPGTGPVGATITITSNGVSPKTVTVTSGSVVTFVNNDNRSHEMASDPHPAHSDCPPINALGTLSAGQTRNTGNLTTTRTCGFHDHNDSTNAALQGTITIR